MAFSLNENVIKYTCIICVAGHSYWHPFGTSENFEKCAVCDAEISHSSVIYLDCTPILDLIQQLSDPAEEQGSNMSSCAMVFTSQPILDSNSPPKDAHCPESNIHPTSAASSGISVITSSYNLQEFCTKKEFIGTKGFESVFSNVRQLMGPNFIPKAMRNMNNGLPNHNFLNKNHVGCPKIQQTKSIFSAVCRKNDAGMNPSAGYNGPGLAPYTQQADFNSMEMGSFCDFSNTINNRTNTSPSQPKFVDTFDNQVNEAALNHWASQKKFSALLENNPVDCVFLHRNDKFGIRNKMEDRHNLVTVLKHESPAVTSSVFSQNNSETRETKNIPRESTEMLNDFEIIEAVECLPRKHSDPKQLAVEKIAKKLSKHRNRCRKYERKLEQIRGSNEWIHEWEHDATEQEEETENDVKILDQQLFNRIVRTNMNPWETNSSPAIKEPNAERPDPEIINILYMNQDFKPSSPVKPNGFLNTKKTMVHTSDNKSTRVCKDQIIKNFSVREPNVKRTNKNRYLSQSPPYHASGDAKLHGFVNSQLLNCFPPGSSIVQTKQKKRFQSKIIKQMGRLSPSTSRSYLRPICYVPESDLRESIVPIKIAVQSTYIPTANELELSPYPVMCPMCQKNYFIGDLGGHIEIDHPRVPMQITRPLEMLGEYFDPMKVFLHENKCLMACFLSLTVRDFGVGKFKDLLPILVMTRRIYESTGNAPIPGAHFPLCIWVCGLRLPFPISFRLSIGHGTEFHRSISGDIASIRTEYSAEITPAIIINHNEEHCYMKNGKIEFHLAVARESTTRYASGIYCVHVRPPRINSCYNPRN